VKDGFFLGLDFAVVLVFLIHLSINNQTHKDVRLVIGFVLAILMF